LSRLTSLSLPEARRLAVAAQGFGPKPAKPSIAHVRKLASRIHAFQIDSVNVLARAHYVPAFARLGPYPVAALDELAYRRRELFEYWAHAACLLPISLYPLLRFRMDRHRDWMDNYLRSPRGAFMAKCLAEVAERGAIAAGDLAEGGKSKGSWWGWSAGKAAMERLFDAGLLAIAGRRGFERLYDLTERVIPRQFLDKPPLPREQGVKELLCLSAAAQGVGTGADLAAYFYIDGYLDRSASIPRWAKRNAERQKPVAKRALLELLEDGRLAEVRVEGWKDPAYMLAGTRAPKKVEARGLVTPFDSLVWDRARLKRLFGMQYTIEIYTPAHKRVYGYYVFPFLLGDALVARCDLKADRARGVLMVQSAHFERGADARRVALELSEELAEMKKWLSLEKIDVAKRGNLAAALKKSL
jgi:uncharacterized protein